MNGVVSRMIETQALLFLYMLCGYIVGRLRILREDNREPVVRILMDVAMPMMILNAFNKPVSHEEILSALGVMGISLAGCLSTWALGALLWRRQPDNRRHVLMYGTMFSNAGNAGLPIMSLVFGPLGVFYGSMYLIPPRILQWTVGMGFFTGRHQKGWLKRLLLHPMVVMIYIGAFLMATGWQITGPAGNAIAGLGAMVGPLSMILIGAALTQMNPRMLLDRTVLVISGIRLIFIPLATAMILRLFGCGQTAMAVAVVLLAMPVASNTAAMAERYGGDYVFASACVSVSTLFSVLTVPLITWFIQMI